MSLQYSARTIGLFEGEMPGPLVIAIGALHGNEPAGVSALEMVFEALELARRDQPDFKFHGKLVGLIGNAQAFLLRQRFLDRDLNRLWTPETMAEIRASDPETLSDEKAEAFHLFSIISAECQSTTTENIIFLDLHTTSADGGIFSIPIDEGESLQMARHLGAPAILGLQEMIRGNLLSFATEGGFCRKHKPPVCVAFEAGQHDSAHAVSRAASAMVRCLRNSGCIDAEGLSQFTEGLDLPFLNYAPPVVRFLYAHPIEAADEFKMLPGFANFQPIRQGEHLADDVHGPVYAPETGLILMPLYQKKGSDGFFIVQ